MAYVWSLLQDHSNCFYHPGRINISYAVQYNVEILKVWNQRFLFRMKFYNVMCTATEYIYERFDLLRAPTKYEAFKSSI